VLKFERYSSEYSSKIAILGLYYQTYRRSLSYHARYYFWKYDGFDFTFKPFFARRGENYTLFRPPCTTVPCLWDVLSNPQNQAARVRSASDYWYRENLKKPESGFPRIIHYARALPAILNSGEQNPYFVTQESLDLIKYLVKRFKDHAEENDMVPVCLLLYATNELADRKSGLRWDTELVRYLESESIRYVDTGSYILEHHTQDDDFNSLRSPDGHMNARGDRMIGAALAKGLLGLGLLED
jgi:hypothetical protein